jgi:hypothetical protein
MRSSWTNFESQVAGGEFDLMAALTITSPISIQNIVDHHLPNIDTHHDDAC